MSDRQSFAEKLSKLKLKKTEQAIAFLWFYRRTQTYEERTASELAADLAEEGLGQANTTRLHRELTKSKQTVKGKRPKTLQLHTKYVPELDKKYVPLVELKEVDTSPSVIPDSFVKGTRPHLEQLIRQINGVFNYGFYDACAVLIRRILESLIIEVFIAKKLTSEIRVNNSFLPLDKLIGKITNHSQIILSRNTPSTLEDIKRLGDIAAHDRNYITQLQDINEHKVEIRRVIKELLTLAGIHSQP
jgi:hypothetical protein